MTGELDIVDFVLDDSPLGAVDAIELKNDGDISAAFDKMCDAAEVAYAKELTDDYFKENPDYRRDRSSVESQYAQEVAGHFDNLKPRFEVFMARMASAPRTMYQHLGDTKSHIESDNFSQLRTISNTVSRWTGRTANQFEERYIHEFPDAVHNQQGICADLQIAMAAYEAIIRAERQGAFNVAEKAEEAFDSLAGKDAPSVEVVLAVVALAAGVAGTAISGGGTLALSLAFVGGSTGVIGAAMSGGDEEPEKAISGGSVEEVVASLESALDTLESNVRKAESTVATAIQESYNEVNSFLTGDVANKSKVLAHQPDYHGPNITDGVEIEIDEDSGGVIIDGEDDAWTPPA